ncbi:unnamed protein product [Amoebophrya sp. A120]|nr:unnamed protein product [Amoebophrya sp. A120]|eukprot:GSA120T00011757001.1
MITLCASCSSSICGRTWTCGGRLMNLSRPMNSGAAISSSNGSLFTTTSSTQELQPGIENYGDNLDAVDGMLSYLILVDIHYYDLLFLLLVKVHKSSCIALKYATFGLSEMRLVRSDNNFYVDMGFTERRMGFDLFYDGSGCYEQHVLEQLLLSCFRTAELIRGVDCVHFRLDPLSAYDVEEELEQLMIREQQEQQQQLGGLQFQNHDAELHRGTIPMDARSSGSLYAAPEVLLLAQIVEGLVDRLLAENKGLRARILLAEQQSPRAGYEVEAVKGSRSLADKKFLAFSWLDHSKLFLDCINLPEVFTTVKKGALPLTQEAAVKSTLNKWGDLQALLGVSRELTREIERQWPTIDAEAVFGQERTADEVDVQLGGEALNEGGGEFSNKPWQWYMQSRKDVQKLVVKVFFNAASSSKARGDEATSLDGSLLRAVCARLGVFVDEENHGESADTKMPWPGSVDHYAPSSADGVPKHATDSSAAGVATLSVPLPATTVSYVLACLACKPDDMMGAISGSIILFALVAPMLLNNLVRLIQTGAFLSQYSHIGSILHLCRLLPMWGIGGAYWACISFLIFTVLEMRKRYRMATLFLATFGDREALLEVVQEQFADGGDSRGSDEARSDTSPGDDDWDHLNGSDSDPDPLGLGVLFPDRKNRATKKNSETGANKVSPNPVPFARALNIDAVLDREIERKRTTKTANKDVGAPSVAGTSHPLGLSEEAQAEIKAIYESRFRDFRLATNLLALNSPEDLLAFRVVAMLTGGTFLGNAAARYSNADAIAHWCFLCLCVGLIVHMILAMPDLQEDDGNSNTASESDGSARPLLFPHLASPRPIHREYGLYWPPLVEAGFFVCWFSLGTAGAVFYGTQVNRGAPRILSIVHRAKRNYDKVFFKKLEMYEKYVSMRKGSTRADAEDTIDATLEVDGSSIFNSGRPQAEPIAGFSSRLNAEDIQKLDNAPALPVGLSGTTAVTLEPTTRSTAPRRSASSMSRGGMSTVSSSSRSSVLRSVESSLIGSEVEEGALSRQPNLVDTVKDQYERRYRASKEKFRVMQTLQEEDEEFEVAPTGAQAGAEENIDGALEPRGNNGLYGKMKTGRPWSYLDLGLVEDPEPLAAVASPNGFGFADFAQLNVTTDDIKQLKLDRELFQDTATSVLADLDQYFQQHPAKIMFMPCTVELFRVIYAALATLAGVILAALYSKGVLFSPFAFLDSGA